mgnify:CR=1 FL=1
MRGTISVWIEEFSFDNEKFIRLFNFGESTYVLSMILAELYWMSNKKLLVYPVYKFFSPTNNVHPDS